MILEERERKSKYRERRDAVKVKGRKESRTKKAVNADLIKDKHINHTSIFIPASLTWLTSVLLLVF